MMQILKPILNIVGDLYPVSYPSSDQNVVKPRCVCSQNRICSRGSLNAYTIIRIPFELECQTLEL
ncbi:hypothetical protein SAMN05518669_14211 [Variovorax sp. YR634]|nr:hypothetical protein SAMN05518669_14211 [Variovorax sp. YR634]